MQLIGYNRNGIKELHYLYNYPVPFSASCFLRAAAIKARMFDLTARGCATGAFFLIPALTFFWGSGITLTQPFSFNFVKSLNFRSTSET